MSAVWESIKRLSDAFLEAVTPAAIEAMQLAMQQLEADHDAALCAMASWSWNGLATKQNAPSANIARSSRKTDS